MKVGIIAPYSLYLSDGTSVLAHNISQALANRNINVKLLTIEESMAENLVPMVDIPNFSLYIYRQRYRNVFFNSMTLYLMALRNSNVINDVDIIHVIGNYNPFLASFIANYLKKPEIIHLHIKPHKFVANVFNLLSIYRLLRIKKVIATSINIARQIHAEDIILPPIDCHTFKPKRLINTTDEVKMLYLGPFQRFDILTVLKIMIILKKNFNVRSSLTLISRFPGDKELIPKILRLAAKFNLEGHVKAFVKTLSLQEKIGALNESTVYVGLLKPNKNFPFVEPPISILEALSMGKPVIGYDNIGLNSFPNSESIVVLNSRTVNNKLAARIIADKVSSLDQLSLSARKLALENFSYEVISDRLIKIYKELLNNF
jgi:glycosyltransferase involved in cell wall biosynthesis